LSGAGTIAMPEQRKSSELLAYPNFPSSRLPPSTTVLCQENPTRSAPARVKMSRSIQASLVLPGRHGFPPCVPALVREPSKPLLRLRRMDTNAARESPLTDSRRRQWRRRSRYPARDVKRWNNGRGRGVSHYRCPPGVTVPSTPRTREGSPRPDRNLEL
jgi:hypothetical protein